MNDPLQAVSEEEVSQTMPPVEMSVQESVPTSSIPPNQGRWGAGLRLANRKLLVVAVGGILMAGAGIALPRRLTAPNPEPPSASAALPVETIMAQAVQSYSVTRAYTGEVTATRASEIGFEQAGTLVWVGVDPGDRVQTGAAIARLDTQNLEAQLNQLRAQKAQAEAVLQELQNGPRVEVIAAARSEVSDLQNQLTLEEIRRDRREVLYEKGAIAREQLDEVDYNRNALQARLGAAQSQLTELENGTRSEQLAAQVAAVQQLAASIAEVEITIAKSTIRAPFAGVVSERRLDEGTVVSAGQAIVRLVERDTPEVEVGVPVEVAAQLAVGSAQQVQIGETPVAATVMAVKPEVNPTTRTRTVVLALQSGSSGGLSPEALLGLAPDQIARLAITQTVATEGIWLPTTALTQSDRGLWSCFVLVNNTVERRDVEVLHTESDSRSDPSGNRVLVRGLLQAGDRVVTDGVQRLVSGQAIQG